MDFKKLGFSLINEKKGTMKIKCPKEHIFSISYRALANRKENEKCYLCVCRVSKNNPTKDIKIITKEWGYKVNTKKYKNGNSKLKFECVKNHVFNETWNNFKRKKNKCPVCNTKSTLRTEDEIYNWLNNLCNTWNIELLTTLENFEGRKIKSKYKCLKCQKTFESTVDGIEQRNKNNKCPWCTYGKSQKNGRRQLKDIIDEMKDAYESNDISVGKIIDTSTHVELKCNKCNTVFFKNYNDSKKFGYRCNNCCKSNKNTFITGKLAQSKFNDNKVNRIFDLSYNWVKNQYKKQNGKCFYTNMQMDWTSDFVTGCSVDRLYNNLGHIIDNCVLVIPAINMLKNNMHHWEFINWIKLLKIHFSNETHKINIFLSKYEQFITNMINRAKYNNRLNVNKHEITFDDVYKLIKNQKNRCIISNLPLIWKTNNMLSGSIDRIESKKGYIADNIQLTNKYINYMKGAVLNNNQCKFILKQLVTNKDLIDKVSQDILLSIESKQIQNNINNEFKFEVLLLRIKFLKLLEKNNYRLFDVNSGIVIKENNTIRVVCPMKHICNTSYNLLLKNKILECKRCEQSDIHDINNSVIDNFLLKNNSNLTRVKDYPGSPYKAIEFRCALCKNIIHLKWLNLQKRPYCPICKKKDFKHNILTEELRKFVINEYNGKLLGKFRGYKRKIKFQCEIHPDGSGGHIFEKSPQCIGFMPDIKEKRKWCCI